MAVHDYATLTLLAFSTWSWSTAATTLSQETSDRVEADDLRSDVVRLEKELAAARGGADELRPDEAAERELVDANAALATKLESQSTTPRNYCPDGSVGKCYVPQGARPPGHSLAL